MYRYYQHAHDKRIFADREYEHIPKYMILNEERMVLLINIPAEDIENNKSWVLIEENED